MIILFSLLTFSLSSRAVVNLEGCENHLVVTPTLTVPLKPNQLGIRGKLHPFWETGMEDNTWYSIIDEFVYTHVAPRIETSLHGIGEGDYLYILDDEGHVVFEGYYREERIAGSVNIFGREIEVSPNRPRLYKDAEFQTLAMTPGDLESGFRAEANAVLIRTVDDRESERLKTALAPWLARYERDQNGPSRKVRLGKFVITPKAYEEVVRGRLEIEPVTYKFGSGDERFINVHLIQGDQRIRVNIGEQIYLLDRDGKVFDQRTLENRLDLHEDVLRRAHEAVLVRR